MKILQKFNKYQKYWKYKTRQQASNYYSRAINQHFWIKLRKYYKNSTNTAAKYWKTEILKIQNINVAASQQLLLWAINQHYGIKFSTVKIHKHSKIPKIWKYKFWWMVSKGPKSPQKTVYFTESSFRTLSKLKRKNRKIFRKCSVPHLVQITRKEQENI